MEAFRYFARPLLLEMTEEEKREFRKDLENAGLDLTA